MSLILVSTFRGKITKIEEVDARIAELERLRESLQDLSAAAKRLPQDDIEMKHCVCHLVQGRADTPTARGFVLQP